MTSIGEFCRCGHWKFDHDKLFGCKLCTIPGFVKEDWTTTGTIHTCRRFYSAHKFYHRNKFHTVTSE